MTSISRTGPNLYRHARTRIPGGTQLLSKRPEMFLPDEWPSYYSRARGTRVWDLDGREYVDMSYNGIGACVLGAADPDVDAAVMDAIRNGSMSTLNCPEEVELADLLCEIHPWADMVRFARSGGESAAMAIRIARAATGRDRIAFCGYHGWQDWYLAANLAEDSALDGHLLSGLAPAGVPRGLAGTALPFRYNHLEELEQILGRYPGEVGVIMMEPIRSQMPDPGFLAGVRAVADRTGAVLIFDEITAAFRLNSGGAHLTLGISPDIAVFAKGLSNGYPMATVIGRRGVMEAAQNTFISSTFWTERIGPVAALATIRKHQRSRVADHLDRIGTLVQDGWKAIAHDLGLDIEVGGIPPLSHFSFSGQDKQAAHTVFTRLMLQRGFLASKGFYATLAHTEDDVARYLESARAVFAEVQTASAEGALLARLEGGIAHSGFSRLT